MSVLKCHQQATGLNQAIHRCVENFETQFDEKSFVYKVLMSLTWSNSNDPDADIKELSNKYDLDIRKRVIDVVLKNLATTIVQTETLKLALSMYIQEPRLQQVATNLRSEIQTSQRNLIDRRALDSVIYRS